MPLTTDEQTVAVSHDLINGLNTIFGAHPGARATHAKGIMVTGTFKPTPVAKELTTAPHFNNDSTPVTVRFSNSTGIPAIPDADPNGNPRGIAIRFNLGEHVHTDVIAHSTPFFPARTGAEFLEFLKAIGSSPPGAASPTPIEQFLGSHPKALAFVTAPKPTPTSYAREQYFGVNAYKLIDSSGKETHIRYRVVPEAGVENISEEELKAKGPNFLQDELTERLSQGPAKFRLMAQIAEEGDVVDDATEQWPESRHIVELGAFEVQPLVQDQVKEQKWIIYDPTPRVKGIEASADPLLAVRDAVYIIDGKLRRNAT